MESKDLAGHSLYTRNIQVASNLLAIGCQMRAQMGVTATKSGERPEELLFWFENTEIECAGVNQLAEAWLKTFLCPWSEFKLGLEHPVAYLKAAAENREILVRAARGAMAKPFRVLQHGNRIAVLGPGVSEMNARKLLSL